MRPDKIRRMDACNVAASQIPFGTSVAIFLGIAPTKGHAGTHIVGAPIRETQGHERIEGRVNGQEQLCLVEAVNEPWGWVGQDTSFQDVKPRAAKEPDHPSDTLAEVCPRHWHQWNRKAHLWLGRRGARHDAPETPAPSSRAWG